MSKETKEWKTQESEFHKQQAVLRTKIRLSNDRGTALDRLAYPILTLSGLLAPNALASKLCS